MTFCRNSSAKLYNRFYIDKKNRRKKGNSLKYGEILCPYICSV